ncbi:MAG: lysophospholipid acyltransferase family protein [Anaerosomatales bacterium]|nr:lysophospholipid acyltransferase family protein [Anaerosomatales bacterium]MDT8433471.1 lysophospholipid acyltransferase family protein [Anaerosomatales bacterium]
MRLARTLRATLAHVLLAAYRTRSTGAQNVPPGGAILAGNHASYLDPILLWCNAPRPVHFMAKVELWNSRVIGGALDRLWAFPVHRGAPDRAAVTTATELLSSGKLVGIFPEGTRHRTEGPDLLGTANAGAAFLAMRAGVPVVPVGIHGTAEALPRGARMPRFPRVAIRYGQPVYPEEFAEGGRKERVEAMTTEIMRRIALAMQQAREA